MLQDKPRDFGAEFTLTELLLLIGIITASILLLLPALHRFRKDADRAKCQGNLLRLAFAADNYCDFYGAFPTLSNADRHTVFVALLPFVEEDALYQDITNGPMRVPGSFIGASPPSQYVCPSDRGIGWSTIVEDPTNRGAYYSVSSYKVNGAGKSFTPADGVIVREKVTSRDITDGMCNTILLGERYNYDYNWSIYATKYYGWPQSYRLSLFGSEWVYGLNHSPFGSGCLPLNYMLPPSGSSSDGFSRSLNYGSGHGEGVNFAFCDSSVHFIRDAINATLVEGASLLTALCTRAGGEKVYGSDQ